MQRGPPGVYYIYPSPGGSSLFGHTDTDMPGVGSRDTGANGIVLVFMTPTKYKKNFTSFCFHLSGFVLCFICLFCLFAISVSYFILKNNFEH